jgi:hypothetical protein
MFDIVRAKRTDTTEFKFHRLSPSADKPITLHVRQLGRRNAAYADATFTRKPDLVERKGSEQLAHELEQDIADIAAFCVASWENVTDGGKPVECTPEKALAFLKFALENGYDEEINALRMTVKMAASFREPVDLGKE